jgi:hypothetical protein
LELAVFAYVKESADLVALQPLWLSPWILSTVALDLVSNVLFVNYQWILMEAITQFGPSNGMVIGVGWELLVSYLPIVIPTMVSFRARIMAHIQLVDQMKSFSIRQAKCTFESDRPVVETKVKELYGDIDKFDQFVRSNLRYSIEDRIGSVTRIPYGQAMLAFLPMIYSSMTNILGCDGAKCSESALVEGYPTLNDYMLSQVCCWTALTFMVLPTTYPMAISLMYQCMVKVSNKILQILLCTVSCVFAYAYMSFMSGLVVLINSNAWAMGTTEAWVQWAALFGFLFASTLYSYS